jgi:hypothetical protein
MNKKEALRLIEVNRDIEILDTPKNNKKVRALIKEYGFVKLGGGIDRGGKMYYYAHPSEYSLKKDYNESYFVIQWAGRYGFSPLREDSGLGCDLESGRLERILKEISKVIA